MQTIEIYVIFMQTKNLHQEKSIQKNQTDEQQTRKKSKILSFDLKWKENGIRVEFELIVFLSLIFWRNSLKND